MIVAIGSDELRRLISSELGVDLKLSFSKNIVLSLRAKGVTASMEIRLQPLSDGSLEIDMESVKLAGLGLFGVPRKLVGDIVLKQAKNFPQINLFKNDRGNIQLSIPGIKMLSCNLSNETLTLEAVCLV